MNNPTTYYRIMNAMRKEDGRDENERATDIVNDIHQLLERLHQTFTTANGTKVNVRGDFTKLCLMPDLNARQRTLLHSLEMTAKKIPGTQETRNIMCKYMTGYCVRYAGTAQLARRSYLLASVHGVAGTGRRSCAPFRPVSTTRS